MTIQGSSCPTSGIIDTASLMTMLPTLDLPHYHQNNSSSRRLEEWSLAVLFTLLPPTVVVKILSLLLLEQSLVVCGSDCGPGQSPSLSFSTHPINIPFITTHTLTTHTLATLPLTYPLFQPTILTPAVSIRFGVDGNDRSDFAHPTVLLGRYSTSVHPTFTFPPTTPPTVCSTVMLPCIGPVFF